MFKHNICGEHPKVPDGMPDSSVPLPLEFFMHPKCPSVPAAIEDTPVGANPSEAAKEPEENASSGDQS